MEVELYDRVALKVDLPEYRLKRGDLATLIDFVPDPESKEEGCVLEVFNAIGESIMVIAVPRSAIQPLQANEVLSVRSLEAA